MHSSLFSRGQLHIERLLDNGRGCGVEHLLLTSFSQEPSLYLLCDVVVLLPRLRAAKCITTAANLSLSLLFISFHFVWGPVASRPNLRDIPLHHEVNTGVLTVLARQKSNLVASVGLKPWHSRVERNQLLFLFHELSEVLL